MSTLHFYLDFENLWWNHWNDFRLAKKEQNDDDDDDDHFLGNSDAIQRHLDGK